MHHDPFRDLEVEYGQLTRRPPDWVALPFVGHDLDELVSTIRNDRPDPAASDAALRALTGLACRDQRAVTVALYALAGELRRRLSRAATAEYRADALGELAVVILEANAAGPGLGHRYVNRAHNRTSKHHHRVRHHGRAMPSIVDPLPIERVIEYQDRQNAPADIADAVAERVDLERFYAAVGAAIVDGELSETVWRTYANHRLRIVYSPDRAPVPTRQRVAAYRAAKRLQPFIDTHLRGHAA